MAQSIAHPEQRERTRWEVFEASERALLVPLAAQFEGCAEREVRVSSTALVHVDRNRYSVDCRYAGKTVSLRTYAERIVAVAAGPDRRRACAQLRARSHLLRSLALRGGAGEEARGAAQRRAVQGLGAAAGAAGDEGSAVRKAGGDRQFVTILATIAEDGIEAVSVACELALEANAISDGYVLNALNRFKPQPPVEVVEAPQRLQAQGGAPGRCGALRPAAEETGGGGDRGDADVDGGGVESAWRCPMERHDMLLKLKALKLHGMVAAFDEVIDEGIKRSRTPFDVLGRLLAAEDSERHARSIRYQMTGGQVPRVSRTRQLRLCRIAGQRAADPHAARGRLHRGDPQHRPGRRTRHRQEPSRAGAGDSSGQDQSARALLQRRRSGQPARAGESGRQARSPRAAARPTSMPSCWTSSATCPSAPTAARCCST